MNLKQKVLSGVVALSMVTPLTTVAALAADADTKSTDVTYKVTEGYTWSIHTAIDFGEDKGVNETSVVDKTGTDVVQVTKNVIGDGKKLNITVAGSGSDGAFTIANGNTVLAYDVAAGDAAVQTGGTVLDVAAGTNSASKEMHFTLHTSTGTSEVAGSYTGKITYTAAIVNQ